MRNLVSKTEKVNVPCLKIQQSIASIYINYNTNHLAIKYDHRPKILQIYLTNCLLSSPCFPRPQKSQSYYSSY